MQDFPKFTSVLTMLVRRQGGGGSCCTPSLLKSRFKKANRQRYRTTQKRISLTNKHYLLYVFNPRPLLTFNEPNKDLPGKRHFLCGTEAKPSNCSADRFRPATDARFIATSESIVTSSISGPSSTEPISPKLCKSNPSIVVTVNKIIIYQRQWTWVNFLGIKCWPLVTLLLDDWHSGTDIRGMNPYVPFTIVEAASSWQPESNRTTGLFLLVDDDDELLLGSNGG